MKDLAASKKQKKNEEKLFSLVCVHNRSLFLYLSFFLSFSLTQSLLVFCSHLEIPKVNDTKEKECTRRRILLGSLVDKIYIIYTHDIYIYPKAHTQHSHTHTYTHTTHTHWRWFWWIFEIEKNKEKYTACDTMR